MGVTGIRHYFTRIIGHNSVNVHWIPTKLGTDIRCNAPFNVPNFSLIGARIRVLFRILQSVQKEEKNKEK